MRTLVLVGMLCAAARAADTGNGGMGAATTGSTSGTTEVRTNAADAGNGGSEPFFRPAPAQSAPGSGVTSLPGNISSPEIVRPEIARPGGLTDRGQARRVETAIRGQGGSFPTTRTVAVDGLRVRTVGGVTYVRGVVGSQADRAAVLERAVSAAGSRRVVDQLTVDSIKPLRSLP